MDDELRAMARQLRLDGMSCHQIAEELGVTQRSAEHMVEGLPVPEWTRRPNAKDDLRARARSLRAQGKSYNEIAAELGVSKSSCSLWLRDMARPEPKVCSEEHLLKMQAKRKAYWEAAASEREAARRAQVDAAAAAVSGLTKRELLIAGAMLYWAEGSKSKPWRPADRVVFINSDPELIHFFLAWLRLMQVAEDRLALSVSIHESADVDAAMEFWSTVTGIPVEQFGKTNLKRHNPKTVRRNTGDTYHGCLTIRVRQSADLYRTIEGSVKGIVAGARLVDPQPSIVERRQRVDIANLRSHVTKHSQVV